MLEKRVLAAILVGILVGLAVGYAASSALTPKTLPAPKEEENIVVPIGALLLLSGAQESYGKRG